MEMNERIRELNLQALCEVMNGPDPDGDVFNKMYIPSEFTKKFAELIVLECMRTCDETQATYLKHRKASDDFQDKNIYAEGEAACDIIKYKMKKQFGVE
jgi:hypothetical protein